MRPITGVGVDARYRGLASLRYPKGGVLHGDAKRVLLRKLALYLEGSWRALHAFGTQIAFACDVEPQLPALRQDKDE